jgi:hypothetical protein
MPLAAGDTFPWGFRYDMDKAMHDEDVAAGGAVLNVMVAARVFVSGELAVEVKKPARDMQRF